MRKLSSLVLALAVLGVSGPAIGEEETGSRPALSYGYDDGLVQIEIPDGWEANPRLAADNGVKGFFHPTGMRPGEDVPIWVLVERRERPDGIPFEKWMEGVLAAGRTFDYIVQDSTTLQSADGRPLRDFRFNPSAEGEVRGLTFLETPHGALLFRRQAESGAVWDSGQENVSSLLAGIRFVVR